MFKLKEQSSGKAYLLLSLLFFFSILLVSCSNKTPLVKIVNQSRDTIDVRLENIKCRTCPPDRFLNNVPFSETFYSETSINQYLIIIYKKEVLVKSETVLSPEVNKKYKIIIDQNFISQIVIEDN